MEQSESDFINRLNTMVRMKAIVEWLKKPNMMFDGRTPQELLDSGEFGPLYRMLYYLESGDPSN